MSANHDEWAAYGSGTVLVGTPHKHGLEQGLAVKLPTGIWLVAIRGEPESTRAMVRPPSKDIDWVEQYSDEVVQEVREPGHSTQSLIFWRRRGSWRCATDHEAAGGSDPRRQLPLAFTSRLQPPGVSCMLPAR